MTEPDAGVRLDVWLDVSCLYKTRSAAQGGCKGGKVEVNGSGAKPHRLLHIGDEICIGRPFGRKQTVIVRGLAAQHLPKQAARDLYQDITPAPSREEVEMRRLERIYRAGLRPTRAPDKRERRTLRKLKGR